MEKIRTIFDRDWEGNRGVVDEPIFPPDAFEVAVATEKLDGTNVRMTVRNGRMVRLEKRRNPSKAQKHIGIVEPWYVDADEFGPEDKYLFEAAGNTPLEGVPDGEWSGEAVGPKIQGNPLNLDAHTVVLFSAGIAPVFEDAPIAFDELREWLPNQKSKFGKDCAIEGIVWWRDGKPFGKIKAKDFK